MSIEIIMKDKTRRKRKEADIGGAGGVGWHRTARKTRAANIQLGNRRLSLVGIKTGDTEVAYREVALDKLAQDRRD